MQRLYAGIARLACKVMPDRSEQFLAVLRGIMDGLLGRLEALDMDGFIRDGLRGDMERAFAQAERELDARLLVLFS